MSKITGEQKQWLLIRNGDYSLAKKEFQSLKKELALERKVVDFLVKDWEVLPGRVLNKYVDMARTRVKERK